MSEKLKIPPRSRAQIDIIQLLVRSKTMTFTQLQNHLKISRPALSRHLSVLLKDETLIFTKKGREKHYKFGPNASKIPERQMHHLWLNYVYDAYDEFWDSELDLKEIIKEHGKKTNAFFMYAFMKSIETGIDWTKAVDIESLLRGFIEISMPKILKKDELPLDIAEKSASVDMDEELPFLANNYFKNNKKPIKEFYKILEEIFPEEVKILNKYNKN